MKNGKNDVTLPDMSMPKIAPDWGAILAEEFCQPYFERLVEFVRAQYAHTVCYPAGRNIFRAFELCPFESTRVVIIGQDPYHGVGQANGLAFAVDKGVPLPPSLRNIAQEAGGCDLDSWARQGVLLLNSVLTVEQAKAASHAGHGWEFFTDAVVRALSTKRDGIVYMLWGNYAQQKAAMVDGSKNLVLRSVHPSPLSAYRGFLGCGHFAKANEYLKDKKIVW